MHNKTIEYSNDLRLLYVEDNSKTREITCKVFEDFFDSIVVAEDGKDGYEKFLNDNFDVVIADINMPHLNGIEMFSKMRKKNKDISLIVLSAYNKDDFFLDSIEIGIDGYLLKPLNLSHLANTLYKVVQKHKTLAQEKANLELLHNYQEAVNYSSIVSKTDPKGNIIYVNDNFCEISGYKQEELIGQPHSIVRHEDMSSDVFKEMWQTLKAKKIWKGIIKNRRKDKSVYYVKSTVMPIFSIEGEVIEYMAIRDDVTDLEMHKMHLETNLKKSSLNLHYMDQIERAIDTFVAVLKTDSENNITYMNKNLSKLSGYDSQELLGQPCRVLRAKKHIDDGDCDRIAQELNDKREVSILFENKTKDQESYYVDTKIYPLISPEGEVTEILHLMYDVTEIITIHKELEDTQKEIITTMGEVGESRSQETGNHVRRVAKYSKLLAEIAGLSDEDADLLYSASPMHDIGKVGIPDSILKKPGSLSEEEWIIMQKHAEISYNILKFSKRPILRAAAMVSYTHHEKWDGSGYPNGSKGEDIHIFGRITAIADVFDALGSDRVYKKAWEIERIISLFKAESGHHFDPNLVKLFLENLDKFLEIRDAFID